MYIISARKGSRGFIKGFKHRGIRYFSYILYYKLKGYEINHGGD